MFHQQEIVIERNISSQFQEEIHSLKEQLAKKDDLLRRYEEEISYLHEMIRKLKQEAFGSKSERWVSQEQLVFVFNEAEVEAKKDDSTDEKSDPGSTTVGPYERKRGKRKLLPSNLPREVVVIDLPEDEKKSSDGSSLVLRCVGKEVSEKLEYQPSVLKVIEYHRLKYEVVSPEGESQVRTAEPLACIIPKGIATASLLAGIIVNKYADGLPLYRQEEIFDRQGVHLPRSTQGRWIMSSAQACQAIWNVLEDRLMASPYVACDETWVQVLNEKGRKAESQSWMWARVTPSQKEKIALFDYDAHRSSEVAKRLLSDYKGYLQTDGYGVYKSLSKEVVDLTLIGCNMHGRRKYADAASHGASGGKSLAEKGLEFYQRLYKIEEKGKELCFEERHELRNREAREEFHDWAQTSQNKVPPKSKIGQAFHYFLNEQEYLRGYLKNGQIEIDNGFVERSIKYFAIGRNNWLFSSTEDGAQASSLYYSFVVTAKINGVNPYFALKRIFEELPHARVLEDYESLANYLIKPELIQSG